MRLLSQECKDENYDFIRKVFLKSGISHNGSYLPAWINPTLTKEPKYDMATAKLEAEMTMCGALADLLEKTGEPVIGQATGAMLTSWTSSGSGSSSCSGRGQKQQCSSARCLISALEP